MLFSIAATDEMSHPFDRRKGGDMSLIGRRRLSITSLFFAGCATLPVIGDRSD